jgi:endoplasmic reticulum-Golgi intermediate compartment protein 3
MLNRLKKVDLYRKVNEDYSESTVKGGVFSLISYSIILILFTSEVYCYLFSNDIPTLIIENSSSNRIRVDLSLTFHHLPCAFMSIMYADVSSKHFSSAYLKKYPIERGVVTWNTQESQEPYKSDIECGNCYGAELYEGQCCNSCEEVIEAYSNKNWAPPKPEDIVQCQTKAKSDESPRGEGCYVTGNILLRKIPVSIRFELNSSGQTFMSMIGLPFNADHTVNHLGFSDVDGEIRPGPMDGKEMKCSIGLYNLKVTPAIKNNIRFYQTSDTYELIKDPAYPLVVINYDIEPITTVYKPEKTFSEFLVSICAIIGGWFAISLMISKFIIN